MNSCVRFFVFIFIVVMFTAVSATGQPQFQVPLAFTGAGAGDTDALLFGLGPSNTRCQDACGFGFDPWCEQASPPAPIGGWNFHAYFINPCTGTELYPKDFRGFTSYSQIDTFQIRVIGNNLMNGSMTISWPSNLTQYGSVWILKKKSGANWNTVVPNMAAGTSYTDPNAAGASQLNYLLIMGQPCCPPPDPNFSFNSSSLNFGCVEVGHSASQSVSVINTGVVNTLIISSILSIPAYTVTPSAPVSIPPGASFIFTVTFSPPTAGLFSGNIIFIHNASGGPSNLPVSGSGCYLGPYFSSNTSALNFGGVPVGGSVTRSITISDTGTTNPLILSSVSPSSGYSITPNPAVAFPISVAPGATQNFDVTCSSTTIGVLDGTISFNHNASGGVTVIHVTARIYDPSSTTVLTHCVGWNLVSVPRTQTNYSPAAVFPGMFGDIFEYSCGAGYLPVPILAMGKGYWMYTPAAANIYLVGGTSGPIVVPACAGWNLIGSREVPVPVSSLIVSGGATIYGDAFGYDCKTGIYQPTVVINPGEAVWLYVTAPCTITIP
jgi:hypothetical protein